MIHAAASSEDHHYQNYIHDLTMGPRAHEYSVKVEGIGKSMEANESEPEGVGSGATSYEDAMDVDYT